MSHEDECSTTMRTSVVDEAHSHWSRMWSTWLDTCGRLWWLNSVFSLLFLCRCFETRHIFSVTWIWPFILGGSNYSNCRAYFKPFFFWFHLHFNSFDFAFIASFCVFCPSWEQKMNHRMKNVNAFQCVFARILRWSVDSVSDARPWNESDWNNSQFDSMRFHSIAYSSEHSNSICFSLIVMLIELEEYFLLFVRRIAADSSS